jgi:hypothetical protein
MNWMPFTSNTSCDMSAHIRSNAFLVMLWLSYQAYRPK